MEKPEVFLDNDVYSIAVRSYFTGVDTAIANYHWDLYRVIAKDGDSAMDKTRKEFKKQFPDKTIDELVIKDIIELKDCLF